MELAKRIDRKTYLYYLDTCHYGDKNLTEKGADFWNFGAFAISPKNQLEFLVKVYEEKLPFSKRNIGILKRVMITETSPAYTIRSKTGRTKANNQDVGWWVGYVQRQDNVYFFATRLIKLSEEVNENFGNYRKELAKNVLKQIKAL